MKAFILASFVFVSVNALADSAYAPININWNDRILSEGFPLQCDDSSYSGVVITVPGTYKFGVEERIIFKDCSATTKITKKQKIVEDGVEKMKVWIKLKDSCEMDIKEDRINGKSFNLWISDAC